MNLRKLVLFFIILCSVSFTAQAQTFKVKKSKGRQAVIESTTPLIEGETYVIQSNKHSGLISEEVTYPKSNRSRENSTSLGLNSTFFKGDNIQEHEIDIEARYGWNFGDFELGPLIHINLLDQGAGFNTDFHIGAYADYNLISNVIKEDYIYGLTGQFFAGNREFTTGSSSQIVAIGAGGFLTWFLSGSTTALRVEGLAETKTIATSTASTSALGFAGKMFFTFYF